MSSKITPAIVPFISVWKTDSDDENITIHINDDYKSDYNYTIYWGDRTNDNDVNDSITHTYSSAGSHTVKIIGKFPAISGKDPTKKANSEKLQKIIRWGDIKWRSFENAFRNCSNLDVIATDTPALSDVNSTSSMFRNAYNLKGNGYFKDWDLSHVANTSYMFYNAKAFNQPLNNWNVSKVTSMASMFNRATVFNKLINNWDVGKVRDMNNMFYYATAFNQPLDNWNVGSVTYMGSMFVRADAFNHPLDKWDVSSVTSMAEMFSNATAFNKPLDKWNVRSVTDMRGMFQGASAFTNQDLSTWLVINVPSDKHGRFIKGSGIRNTEPFWRK
jgi:surface protein